MPRLSAGSDATVEGVYGERSSREGAGTRAPFAEAVHDTHPDAALAWNYSSNFNWTAEDDPLTFADLGELGYGYIFITLFGRQATTHPSYELVSNLAANAEGAQFDMERAWEDHEAFADSTDVFFELGGFGDFQPTEGRYLEDAAERFESSVGYDER